MILSIIVISHNQKEQLRRCLDSILSQDLPFEHEIIVSDDASNDGTWELALQYDKDNACIHSYRCDSNEFNPANNSERSGWNRCNGYKHVMGKYIAHIDADDYHLNGKCVYKKQVELLEQHPECSCCMANDYTLQDGESEDNCVIRHKEHFENGEILKSESYVRNLFRESHCFVYRRNLDVDPVATYGGFYVDALITYHHVQFGDIVCLDEASYVYVQYKSSIWAMTKKSKDRIIIATTFYVPYLVPRWRGIFTQGRGRIRQIMRATRMSLYGYELTENSKKWVGKYDMYFYTTFLKKLNICDYIRLTALYLYATLLFFLNPMYKWPHKLLSKLLY